MQQSSAETDNEQLRERAKGFSERFEKLKSVVPNNTFAFHQCIEAARLAHEANRTYSKTLGDHSQLEWHECPNWQAQSAFNGVCFAVENDFSSPEEMHKNWLREKLEAGWIWGPLKDVEKKQHPCLMGYPSLPAEQREKDGIFLSTILQFLSPQKVQTIAAVGAEDDSAANFIWHHAAGTVFGGMFLTREDQALCMAAYFRAHPDAPENSAEIEVRMRLGIELLPQVPDALRWLAVSLFKQALLGRDAFQRAYDAAEKAKLDFANAPQPAKLDEDERSFHQDSGLTHEPSDIAKALATRAAAE